MSIYGVNGKNPIAAWIPSRDDAGNGTATLNDLVGSNNGTLTNMDAATDWVVDTGAGGVRALDFDGVNDSVNAGTSAGVVSGDKLTVSFWLFLRRAITTTQLIVFKNDAAAIGNYGFWTFNSLFHFWVDTTTATRSARTAAISTNQWVFVSGVYDGAIIRLYINGASVATTAQTGNIRTFDRNLHFGSLSASFPTDCRLDDIRIWNQSLNATDVSDLYAGGNGRGIILGGVQQTRRRRDLGGYGL